MAIAQGPRQAKTVRCPYIPEHIMPEKSLLNHLSKCSATNKHLFTKCKFNPLHVYPKQKIQAHYQKCKDRLKYQQQKGESSDDWDSDSEKIQEPKVVEKPVKREDSRTNERNSKEKINQSYIKKIQIDDSDDDWDSILIVKAEKQTKPQIIDKKDLNSSQNIKSENKNSQSQSSSKINNSQIKQSSSDFSCIEKSSVNKNVLKSFQQQSSMKNHKNQKMPHSDDAISLESQSSQEEGSSNKQKQLSNLNNKSCQTLKSHSGQSKNGDNQKNNSKSVIKTTVYEDDLEIDDF